MRGRWWSLGLWMACAPADDVVTPDPADTEVDDTVDDTDTVDDADTDVDTDVDTDTIDDTDVEPLPPWPTTWPDVIPGAWRPGFAYAGLTGDSATRAEAFVVDGDDLVVAGLFSSVDGQDIRGVARWDGSTWTPVGDPVEGLVQSMAMLPDGRLVIGGFTEGFIGLQGFVRVLEGGTWTDIGVYVDGMVDALHITAEGDLVVGGSFHQIGSGEREALARWDGQNWSSFGAFAPWSGAHVHAIEEIDGDLCVTGLFSQLAGSAAGGVGCWDGSAWNAVGALDSTVYGIAELDGRTLAWGQFSVRSAQGPAVGLAEWDGDSWVAAPEGGVDGGLVTTVRDLVPWGDGYVLTGQFQGTSTGVFASNIVQWDGTQWLDLGGIDGALGPVSAATGGGYTLHDDDGTLWVGGVFSRAGSLSVSGLATWASAWDAPFASGQGAPMPGEATHIAVGRDHTVWSIAQLGGGPTLVQWDGQDWNSSHDGPWGELTSLDAGEGLLRVTGRLQLPNATDLCAVAERATTTWHCEVPHRGGYVHTTAEHAGGLYLAGDLSGGVLGWDGTDVSVVGEGLDGVVRHLVVTPTGELYALGDALARPGEAPVEGVFHFDGTAWQGLAIDGIPKHIAWYDGRLLVAGAYLNEPWTGPGRPPERPVMPIATWDGTTWQSWGDLALSFGDAGTDLLMPWEDGLFVSGFFDTAGGAPAGALTWYDGTTWHDLDGGADDLITDMAVGPDGVWFTGLFRRVGDTASFGVAQWQFAP